MTSYAHLFSEWQIRNARIKNRVVFPPTCPSWVSDPWSGLFTDQATAYYAERAQGGVGLIIIGATHVHPSSIMAPLLMPQLFDDRNVGPLAAVAEAVHEHGCKLAIQLWHSGVRGFPTFKQESTYDLDATWYTLSPSQVPLGEFPGASTPKEMSEEEIEEILDSYAAAGARAIRAGLDGVELHMSHGYLPWQFISPLYNKRRDRWGGSAGVHHAFIHTPMEFEAGWEKGYARAIREVSSKPVLLVGRITTPDVAEALLAAGDGDAICLARQLFTDPDWALKAAEGRADDIRRCVAANFCWKSVSRGGRVQCVYNPEIGRERAWGRGTLTRAARPKKALVVGGGPAGLEYARVAAARGHEVVLLEREAELGGHVRLQSLLPSRGEYGEIARWLTAQARKAGADLRVSSPVTGDSLDAILAEERPDHVVVATGSRVCKDGFQGWTGEPLPGWESGNCVGWDEVATGAARPTGEVLVLDDLCDVVAPLTAVAVADNGASRVRLVTRWPMVGLETILDVYLDWILPKLYRAGVELVCDHFVRRIAGTSVLLYNVHHDEAERTVEADWIVMATGRQSVNELYPLLRERGVSVETIGDATAPRGTYEAVYEGHRQARKL